MNLYDIRCRQTGIGEGAGSTRSKGTDNAAWPAAGFKRLRDQVRATGLAIRSRYANHVELRRWGSKETVGDPAQAGAEIRNRDDVLVAVVWRRRNSRCRLPRSIGRASLHRIAEIIQTVGSSPAARQEQPAGGGTTTVRKDVPDFAVSYRFGYVATEKISQCDAHVILLRSHHGWLIACRTGMTGFASGAASGGTPRTRSAPAATSENTGAATAPP